MTLEEAAAFLKANDNFILATHDGPDADGLGAAYALALGLRSIGKTATPVVNEAVPPKFAFMDGQGIFRPLQGSTPFSFKPAEASYIVMDTHDRGFIGDPIESLIAGAPRLLMLDHHELREDALPFQCVDPTASSTCEIVYYLLLLLGAEISGDSAADIFAGIVYDSGSFIYPKTTGRTFACALDLVRKGVQPYEIHKKMFESASVGALILQKDVLATLELAAEDRIAIQSLSRKILIDSGADYEDAEDLINLPLRAGSVEVSVFFKENAEGRLRCSLRSKGAVNVAHIAQNFGGGGHKTASGFSCDRPLEQMKKAVVQNILEYLGNP